MELRTFFTLLLTVMAANIHQTLEQSQGGKCVTSVDIVIVVDGSNSMGDDNFNLQKQAMITLVNTLSINETEVRLGIVVFSTTVTSTLQLSGDRETLIAGINEFYHPDEATNIHLGIREAIQVFNSGARGGSTPKLLLLLTDGTATDSEQAIAAANEAKAINATIFAIGVTDEVNVDELNAIASRDDLGQPRVYLTKNFNELNDSLLNATNRACVDLECSDANIDIAFVLDSAANIGAANFEEMKIFVQDFINFADVNNGNIRVALTSYNDQAQVHFYLNRYDRNKRALIDAIRAIKYSPGGSNAAAAFEQIRTEVFTPANGDRSDVPNVLIFLTSTASGITTEEAIYEADRTRAESVQIYAVGIGLNNLQALDNIASRPSEDNRFNIGSFYDLRPVITSVYDKFNKFCEIPPPVPGCDMGVTDLYFVVDLGDKAEQLSRVQATGDFSQLKNGLIEQIEIVRDPSVNNSRIRVGLITYSDTVQVVVNLTNMGSVNLTASAFDNLPGSISQGGSNLVLALQQIVNPPVDSDTDSHVAIVAPESAFSVGGDLQAELTRLKDLGYKVVIFAIRETGALDVEQLEMEASGSRYFYFLPNYTELEAATKNFTRDQLCGIKRGNGSGLCEGSGHRENGYGVVPHPRDCDKYIQCYYNDLEDLDIGVVRNCPMGLYWNQENKTCVQPHLAMCPYDRCKEDCEAYKMEGACGAYWECENGTSKPMCCQMNFSFVPGVGCQMDFNCKDYCGTEKWCGLCQKKPNWEEPSGYDVMIMGGNMWMPRPCYYEDFDIVDCDCTAPRDYACPADRMYDFTDSETVMAANNGELGGIRINDVEMTSGGLDLGDKSAVHVKVNPMDNPNEPFTLLVRYKEEEAFSPYGEVLFSSGLSCGNGNSLLVSADGSFIHAEVRSANGRSEVKVPTKGLNPESFKDLVVSLADGMLALSIKDEYTQYIAQTKAPGSVCFSCGIDFGAGFNKLSFEGELQKVAVYSCAWPLLY